MGDLLRAIVAGKIRGLIIVVAIMVVFPIAGLLAAFVAHEVSGLFRLSDDAQMYVILAIFALLVVLFGLSVDRLRARW